MEIIVRHNEILRMVNPNVNHFAFVEFRINQKWELEEEALPTIVIKKAFLRIQLNNNQFNHIFGKGQMKDEFKRD